MFVDVLERLSAVVTPDGRLLRCSIDGSIHIKSYLDSPPRMKLALTDPLAIGYSGALVWVLAREQRAAPFHRRLQSPPSAFGAKNCEGCVWVVVEMQGREADCGWICATSPME